MPWAPGGHWGVVGETGSVRSESTEWEMLSECSSIETLGVESVSSLETVDAAVEGDKRKADVLDTISEASYEYEDSQIHEDYDEKAYDEEEALTRAIVQSALEYGAPPAPPRTDEIVAHEFASVDKSVDSPESRIDADHELALALQDEEETKDDEVVVRRRAPERLAVSTSFPKRQAVSSLEDEDLERLATEIEENVEMKPIQTTERQTKPIQKLVSLDAPPSGLPPPPFPLAAAHARDIPPLHRDRR